MLFGKHRTPSMHQRFALSGKMDPDASPFKKKEPFIAERLLVSKIKNRYTLISTSTPLGSSSFINASTVFAELL